MCNENYSTLTLIMQPGGSVVENLSAFQEMQIQSLSQEDPLEKEMATHSNILAWEIPWTEEYGGYSPWGYKELDMTQGLNNNNAISRESCVVKGESMPFENTTGC